MTTPTTPEQATESNATARQPSYQRMFEAACVALGEVGDALGCDPNEGGSEPILDAIDDMKAERDALRAIIVESVDALGTAARVSQTSSIEFLQYVPGEIRNTVDALKADAVRVDWLEQQRQGYGFDGVHEGNRWVVDGPYRTVRIGIDAAMKAAS